MAVRELDEAPRPETGGVRAGRPGRRGGRRRQLGPALGPGLGRGSVAGFDGDIPVSQ